MLMDERDYVLCEDIKDRISKKFIENGWITVSDYGIHSALVIDENVLEVLENYCWDLRRGAGMPGVSVRYVNEKPIVNYDRLGHNKYEPFVFYRDGYGTHPSYIELSEEFRLYHNLHEKYISEEEKNYVVMNNGSEEIVAKLSNISLYIKAKYVISFPIFTEKSTTPRDWAFSGVTFRWWNRTPKPSGKATNKVKCFVSRNPISTSSPRTSTASTQQKLTGRA